MKRTVIPFFLLLCCSSALAGPSLETVLGALRQQSIAANSGDIAPMLKTLPEKGISITHPTGETATMDRKTMEDYLKGYFKSMKPDSYLYGARLLSVDAKDADTITVTVEISESYVLAEKDTAKYSWYREKLTAGLENGRLVFLKAEMEKTVAGGIEGSDRAPAEGKSKE